MSVPPLGEFERGYKEFQAHERRDSMYKVAAFLMQHFWGDPVQMADGLGVLLLTWNQAFYRYGPFDFDKLEGRLRSNLDLLNKYRKRAIPSYSPADDAAITTLFQQLLLDLQICEGKKKGDKSPVSVAKALHVLAPNFFPLWDKKIAHQYECDYYNQPSKKYLEFMGKMKAIYQAFENNVDVNRTGKTLLKLIDEYNYAKFTKGWV